MEKKKRVDAAQAAAWTNLITDVVWDYGTAREWEGVATEARRTETEVHMGRIFGIVFETKVELTDGDGRKPFKYRVAFQGGNVANETLRVCYRSRSRLEFGIDGSRECCGLLRMRA